MSDGWISDMAASITSYKKCPEWTGMGCPESTNGIGVRIAPEYGNHKSSVKIILITSAATPLPDRAVDYVTALQHGMATAIRLDIHVAIRSGAARITRNGTTAP